MLQYLLEIMAQVFGDNSLFIVTGASRGFGKELSRQITRKIRRNSVVVLVSSNMESLSEVKEEIGRDTDAVVKCFRIDLSGEDVEARSDEMFKDIPPQNYNSATLIHNAGTLGAIGKLSELTANSKSIGEYFKLNVESMIILTSIFLRHFSSYSAVLSLVQITSLGALQPVFGLSLYCSAKSARDSLIRMVALEEPTVRCLSYSPGPLLTDMGDALKSSSDDMRAALAMDQWRWFTCEESAARLQDCLGKGEFLSGSHVDIYDLINK